MGRDLVTPRHVVVMGVSGCGKSSVAEQVAARLGGELAEGDDFHTPASVAKMTRGEALTDEDRWPWLRSIAAWTVARPGRTVVACSALRRAYRDVLRSVDPETFFLHLHATPEVLAARMDARKGHFMQSSMLRSQLDTLEPLQPDERGEAIDVSGSLHDTVEAAMAALRRVGGDPREGADSARPG